VLDPMSEDHSDDDDDLKIATEEKESAKKRKQRKRCSDKRFRGIVKKLDYKKKCGLIQWTGRDLYVFNEDIRTYVGDAVEFGVEVSNSGRKKAVDVVVDPDGTQKRVTGKCVSWTNGRGFGLIQKDGERIGVNRRCGFKNKLELKKGATVEFEENTNPQNGKKWAVRVRIIAIDETGGRAQSESVGGSTDSKRGQKRKLMVADEKNDGVEPPEKKQKVGKKRKAGKKRKV